MDREHRPGLGLRKLTGDAAYTFGRQIIAGLLQLVTVIVIARSLGPVGNGYYSVALLVPTMLATLLNLGIGPANAYYLASGAVDGRTVLQAIVRIGFFIVVAGLAIGIACILFFGQRMFPGVPTSLLWLALSVFPLALFQTFLSSVFQGLQEFRTFNLLLLTQPIVTLLLVATLVLVATPDIHMIMAAYVIGYACTVAVSWPRVRIIARQRPPVSRVSSYAGAALRYGYKAHLGNILSFVNYRADIFLVNFLIGPFAAGLYSIAVQLVERLWLISQAVSTVLLPRLSELSNDESKRKETTPLVCRGVLAITAVAAVLLGLAAYPLLLLLFGREYEPSLLPLLLLLPGIIAGSASRVLSNDIAARGRPELNMYFAFVTVVANIIGNVVLIPIYGLAGAAIATTLAYTLNLALRMGVYASITGNGWGQTLLLKSADVFLLARALRRR